MKFLIFILVLFNAQANACDSISVSTLGSVVVRSSGAVHFLQVSKTGPSCDFFLTFSPGSSGSFQRQLQQGRYKMNYNLYSSPNKISVLKAFPPASINEVLSGRFNSSGFATQNIGIYTELTEKELKPVGTYTDYVQIRVFKGTLSSNTEVSMASLNLTAFQPAVNELSIVDQGSLFNLKSSQRTLNFGILESNESQSIDLLIKSNSPHNIRISSNNSGRLKHKTQNQYVNYSLKINQRNISLHRPTLIPFVRVPDRSSVYRYPLTVTVGNVENALSGPYDDAITISVEAR